MKSIIIVLTIMFCVSVVSCTNNPKQQNTIIGGTEGTTELRLLPLARVGRFRLAYSSLEY